MVKYARQRHLLCFYKIFIKNTLMFSIHEYYLNQWSTIISSLTSLHNIEKTHVLICILSTFFWNASTESKCHSFAKYKYMKVKHQLELLYFQVHEGLVCMDTISTFHILVIIYQSFNVKVFWKIWTTNQFGTYFSSIFLI
jgi:hypothetical protein